MRVRQIGGAAAVLALFWSSGCGQDSPAGPDSVVTVAIASPVEMPFHGASGPGTEPISISFQWTVAVSASGGAGVTVRSIVTELREPASPAILTVIARPETLGPVSTGAPLQVPQAATGVFSSSLYPGQWRGNTSVEILHRSGRAETLRSTFTFP